MTAELSAALTALVWLTADRLRSGRDRRLRASGRRRTRVDDPWPDGEEPLSGEGGKRTNGRRR